MEYLAAAYLNKVISPEQSITLGGLLMLGSFCLLVIFTSVGLGFMIVCEMERIRRVAHPAPLPREGRRTSSRNRRAPQRYSD